MLTVSPAVALALAAVNGDADVAEAVVSNPDPATPLGTDAAHQTPIDPGDRTVQGEEAKGVSQTDDTDGPAAENLDESDNASAPDPESVEANVASNVDASVEASADCQGAGLVLTVVGDQPPIAEGDELVIENIGEFTDTTIVEEPVYNFTIDWGDGQSNSGVATIDSPGSYDEPTRGSFDGTHTYADNGVYTVTVTLTGLSEETVSGTFTVIVNNVAPTLDEIDDLTVDEGETFTITGDMLHFTDPGFDNSHNPEGELTEEFTFAINWGDGTEIDSGPAMIDVHGGEDMLTEGSFEGTHTYADNGVYTVTVTIVDDDGGRDVQTFTVIVNNVAPTLIVPGPQVTLEGATLNLPGIGQVSDPGFDNPLNVGGEVTEQFTFAIDWGDGTELDSGPVTIIASDMTPTTGFFDGSHVYADDGVYVVTVTVNDDDGGRITASFTVEVRNVAPQVVVDPPGMINENESVTLTGSFVDPGLSDQHFVTIDWDDPNDANDSTFTLGATNTLLVGQTIASTTDAAVFEITAVDLETGTVTFRVQHQYLDDGGAPGNGTASDISNVTVAVRDDDSVAGTAAVGVTVKNIAPTITELNVGSSGGGQGGPLVLMGIDAEDGGVDGHGPISVYESVVRDILRNVTNGGSGILVIGGGKNPSDDVTRFWNQVAQDLSVSVTYVNGAEDIAGVSLDGFAMIVVVSDVFNTPNGGLTNAENNALAERAIDVRNFVNSGGGLLGFSSADLANPYGYLGGLGSFTFASPPQYDDITPTPAGSEIGITNALDVCCWHDTYTDFPAFLAVLATRGNTSEAAAIGGRQVVVTSTVIDEGESVTVTGSFADPGSLDIHTVTIDWGDGTTETLTLQVGVRDFTFTHQYPDDGPSPGNSTPADVYDVVVSIHDDDNGQGEAAGLVTVRNVTPEVLLDPAGMILENEVASLTGSYSDPGLPDEHFVTIDWDDPNDSADSTFALPGAASLDVGDTFNSTTDDAVLTITYVDRNSGEVSFRVGHRYQDDGLSPGNSTASDFSTILVTVTDDDQDGGAGELNLSGTPTTLLVRNLAPEIVPGSVGVIVPTNTRAALGDVVTLATAFTDVGMLDGHIVIVDWGDGITSNSRLTPADFSGFVDSSGGQVGAITANHAYAAGGSFTVTVTVIDDDGGRATGQLEFSSPIVIRPPPIPIFVPGGAGGTAPPRPPAPPGPEPRPVAASTTTLVELRRAQIVGVAGAEPKLVLRTSSEAGPQRPPDERLPDDVLDNLQKLFKRLPDGHYQIYLIEPDGTERLVVDVIVRQGRNIDVADETEGAGAASPQVPETKKPEPAAVPPKTDGARHEESGDTGPELTTAALALGGGYLAYAAPLGRRRLGRTGKPRPAGPTKARRLLRRLRCD